MPAIPTSSVAAAQRFHQYVDRLAAVMGHADRHEPLRLYTTALLLPGERKSVEPLAARVEPQRVGARHQSLHHFVAGADWDDTAVLAAVREQVLSALERHGPVTAWLVDDTGLPKKGTHSVGVAHQWCGQLGKQAQCQVAVSLSVANDAASLPIAWRLYLPQDWAADGARRQKAGVPGDVVFQTKHELALSQIRQAVADGVPRGTVLADPAYGISLAFRQALTQLGLRYAVGIESTLTVWREEDAPAAVPSGARTGRPPQRLPRTGAHAPLAVKRLARRLPETAWRTVRWREGTRGPQRGRFARLRVVPARFVRGTKGTEARRAAEWLLIEWPQGEPEPTKYWLSTLPRTCSLRRLVRQAKLRWRVERDYQELKQELGLGHYEGRGWRGFHHHATLCIAAYGFLVADRAAVPPCGPGPAHPFPAPGLPCGFRSRGAAGADGAP